MGNFMTIELRIPLDETFVYAAAKRMVDAAFARQADVFADDDAIVIRERVCMPGLNDQHEQAA